jgi:hypothetical protein
MRCFLVPGNSSEDDPVAAAGGDLQAESAKANTIASIPRIAVSTDYFIPKTVTPAWPRPTPAVSAGLRIRRMHG